MHFFCGIVFFLHVLFEIEVVKHPVFVQGWRPRQSHAFILAVGNKHYQLTIELEATLKLSMPLAQHTMVSGDANHAQSMS